MVATVQPRRKPAPHRRMVRSSWTLEFAMLAATIVIAFTLSWAVARLLLTAFRGAVLDQPNARSLHERPVPRTGGLAVLAGILASLAFGAAELWLPLAAAFVLAAISFIDDLRGLPTGVRLSAHLAVA